VHKQLIDRLCDKIEANVAEITKIETEMIEDADIILICYGTVSRSARSAVRQARQVGIKAGFCRLITIWPFPDSAIQAICKHSRKVIVAEMNTGKIKREVDRCTGRISDNVLLAKPGVELHKPVEILDMIRKMA
jgi:2-oxoglutarate ferredoxin oxidoreductase subunit alpha